MKLRFSAQVPKILGSDDLNEDVVLTDDAQFVICDGASESYDSRTWAKKIAQVALAHDFIPSGESFDSVAREYSASVDYAKLSWSRQASFDRGSFCTLLKMGYSAQDQSVQVTAIGDSEFFLLSPDGFTVSSDPRESSVSCMHQAYSIKCFPYANSAQFQQRPQLISTLQKANAVFSAEYVGSCVKRYAVKKGQFALLMSDAISCWCLKNQEKGSPVWETLLSFSKEDPQSLEKFTSMVVQLRLRREMRIDDTSLVIVEF